MVVPITRGVVQGATSSPVLFNMYIDELGDEVSVIAATYQEKGTAVVVADDVILQASSPEMLQQLLHCASWWQGARDASWSAEKSSYVTHMHCDLQDVCLDGIPLRKVR